jgi:hypothetical protein
MARKKATQVQETKFNHEPTAIINGNEFNAGDIIKIQGEYGMKFKFHSIVTNKETGAQWIDCFELQKGLTSSYRSFALDRVRRIPKKRGKRVNRTTTS